MQTKGTGDQGSDRLYKLLFSYNSSHKDTTKVYVHRRH